MARSAAMPLPACCALRRLPPLPMPKPRSAALGPHRTRASNLYLLFPPGPRQLAMGSRSRSRDRRRRSRSRSKDRRRRSRSRSRSAGYRRRHARSRSRDRRRSDRSRSRERTRRDGSRSKDRSRSRDRDRRRSPSRSRSRHDEQPPPPRPTEGSEAVAEAVDEKKAARLAKLQAWRQQQQGGGAAPEAAAAAPAAAPAFAAAPPQPPPQEGLLYEEGDKEEVDPLDAFMAAEVRQTWGCTGSVKRSCHLGAVVAVDDAGVGCAQAMGATPPSCRGCALDACVPLHARACSTLALPAHPHFGASPLLCLLRLLCRRSYPRSRRERRRSGSGQRKRRQSCWNS